VSVTRRQFLQTAAAVAAARPLRAFAASDRIRYAVVGLHRRGDALVTWARGVPGAELAVLCDLDPEVLERTAAKVARETGVRVDTALDHRRVLERPDVDAVLIATPDQWHTLLAIEAMRAGKDVYVEKPVSHNVWEGRQLVATQRATGRVCQAGTQSRSNPGMLRMIQYVRDGHLGRIQRVVCALYKVRKPLGRRDQPLPIPPGLDFDRWCGPAAKAPIFRDALHHDWHWDFNTGSGDLGNHGVHQMDVARWFLGEPAASPRVVALGGRVGATDAADTPNALLVCHDYPSAPLLFEVRSKPSPDYRPPGFDHVLGGNEIVAVHCEGGMLINQGKHEGVAYDTKGREIERFSGEGHHLRDFFDAVRAGKHERLAAPVREGHVSSAMVHMGNVSYRVGQRLGSAPLAARLKDQPRLGDAFGRLAEHLRANGVDLEKEPLTLGPWLEFDPVRERFVGEGEAAARQCPQYRRDGRPPYVVPEVDA
jgi:predicted dehydrogenase